MTSDAVAVARTRQRWPVIGLALHIGLRSRHGLEGVLFTVGLLAALAAAIPVRALPAEHFMALAVIPLALSGLYLVAAFSHPDGDIMAADSGYPVHLLRLPATSAQLSLTPMALGSIGLAAFWLLASTCILRVRGIPAPLFWPAFMASSVLVWTQALLWMPFPARFLRAALAMALLPALLFGGTTASAAGVGEAALSMAYLLVAIPGAALAMQAVGAARAGTAATPAAVVQPKASAGDRLYRADKPFRSPERAQAWAETRRHGGALVLAMAVCCAIATLPLIWVRDPAPLFRDWPVELVWPNDIAANVTVKTALVCFILPAWLALLIGCGNLRGGGRSPADAVGLFAATRPLRDVDYVRAKLIAAARSTLAAWAVVSAAAILWLLTAASDRGSSGPLGAILAARATSSGLFATALLFGCLVFLTWRNLVSGLFLQLGPRPLASQAYRLWSGLVLPTLVVGFIGGLSGRQDIQRWLVSAWPTVVEAAAIAKLAASGALLALVLRRGIMSQPEALAAAGAWTAVVAAFGLAFRLVLPASWIATRPLIELVVLLIPALRLLAAPLALHRSRHG